jgi:hypothetical protein
MFDTMKKTSLEDLRNHRDRLRYIIDSYAWLEYFIGTAAGDKHFKNLDGTTYIE